MIIKYLLPFILFATLFSCTNRNIDEKKLDLKPVPATVSIYTAIATQLRDYAEKFNKIDFDKILSQLNSKNDKANFNLRVLEFKIAFNKCVDKLQEAETDQSKDKAIKVRELKEYMVELETVWQYIINNYKI